MTRDELQELHFITAIDNVPSIFQQGNLSHRRGARVQHRSVAMAEIQERRRKRTVPGGRALHEYANLYINARNKMMFKVQANHGVDDLTVLRISTAVLDLPGVVIADRNASSDHVRFAASPAGLAQIDRAIVFARYWTHLGDPIAEMDHGSRICAEVLVPDSVDPAEIRGAYVPNDTARTRLLTIAPGLAIVVNGELFFR